MKVIFFCHQDTDGPYRYKLTRGPIIVNNNLNDLCIVFAFTIRNFIRPEDSVGREHRKKGYGDETLDGQTLHLRDLVPKSWSRDNCTPWVLKHNPPSPRLSDRTRNLLQIVVGTGDGLSTVIVRGRGKYFYFLQRSTVPYRGLPILTGTNS